MWRWVMGLYTTCIFEHIFVEGGFFLGKTFGLSFPNLDEFQQKNQGADSTASTTLPTGFWCGGYAITVEEQVPKVLGKIRKGGMWEDGVCCDNLVDYTPENEHGT